MRTRALALMATAAVASVAPLATAAAATPSPVAAQSVIYHQKDSGRTIAAFVGKAFKVRLEVCADCGSSLKLIAPNARVLRVQHRSLTSTAKPPADGGEEFETWTFKTRNPGSASIRVTQRIASGKVSPRFNLTVNVTK